MELQQWFDLTEVLQETLQYTLCIYTEYTYTYIYIYLHIYLFFSRRAFHRCTGCRCRRGWGGLWTKCLRESTFWSWIVMHHLEPDLAKCFEAESQAADLSAGSSWTRCRSGRECPASLREWHDKCTTLGDIWTETLVSDCECHLLICYLWYNIKFSANEDLARAGPPGAPTGTKACRKERAMTCTHSWDLGHVPCVWYPVYFSAPRGFTLKWDHEAVLWLHNSLLCGVSKHVTSSFPQNVVHHQWRAFKLFKQSKYRLCIFNSQFQVRTGLLWRYDLTSNARSTLIWMWENAMILRKNCRRRKDLLWSQVLRVEGRYSHWFVIGARVYTPIISI